MKEDHTTLVDPILFAKSKRSVSGLLEPNKLDRFRKLIDSVVNAIQYEIAFFYDADNRCCIAGQVKATIKLKCNRCLSLFPYEINVVFCLYPVVHAMENSIAKQLDVVVMENGLVSISDIVEDELILGLPEIAKHTADDAACRQAAQALGLQYTGNRQENPFNILTNLPAVNRKN